jgi:lipopolysaccharide/colanic/teichoic acid biosynthesis glycosyltransferase
MALSWSNDFTAGYSTAAEWRKLLRLKPHHSREIIFGFLLRLVVGIVAVIVPAIVLVLIGLFDDWQLNDYLIISYGFIICVMVLFGEHLRSRAYERIISVSDSLPQLETNHKDREIGNEMPAEHAISTFLGRLQKRTLDIVFSVVGLMVLSPLLLVIAVAIKFDTPGPITFRQLRRGVDGRIFSIYKFRTTETSGTAAYPRVTSVGSVLRRTNMNELPSLINVLVGDMSVVGPRPRLLFNEKIFNQEIEQYMSSLKVKSGLTGWAQIHGLRGELAIDDLIRLRSEYDLWYVNNWTLSLDFRIIFMTLCERAETKM